MKNSKKLPPLTFFIIFGIVLLYVMQMGVSPILTVITGDFGITDDVVINLAVDMIFPFIVAGCFLGGVFDKKLGSRRLYSMALLFGAAGLLINLLSYSYPVFLIGRAVFGFGFGLGVPFIGTAIMKWCPKEKREAMDTVNGFFPFIGTVICFLVMSPLCTLFGSWRWAMAVWGVLLAIVLALWNITVKEDTLPDYSDGSEGEKSESYLSLIKRREMLLLCITFICDFCCYSYIALILPTYLCEASGMNAAVSNMIAALAFPLVGLIGCLAGGVIMQKSGLRKPLLVLGQALKFIGVLIAALASTSPILIILGTAVFGFGNSVWMPPLYCVPMELDGMTPSSVGKAFAMMTAAAMLFGFIAPTIGGALTTAFMKNCALAGETARHVFGLSRSLFVFAFVNIIGTVCMLLLPETGKKTIK